MSQTAKIYRYMKTHKRGITGIEALRLFGCFRLPARIADIERQYKVTVARAWVEGENHEGETVRYKRYYLEAT